MSCKIKITFFSNAKTMSNAQKVYKKIYESSLKHDIKLEYDNISEYHKGGYKIETYAVLDTEAWSNIIFEAFIILQSLGYGWSVYGDITYELDARTDNAKFSGLDLITAYIEKID